MITKEKLLAGEVQLNKVTKAEIIAFATENGLPIPAENTHKADMLNDLCDALAGAGEKPGAPGEEQNDPVQELLEGGSPDPVPPVDKPAADKVDKATKAPKSKNPPLLERRAERIAADQKNLSVRPGEVDPSLYGENPPGMMSRRFPKPGQGTGGAE